MFSSENFLTMLKFENEWYSCLYFRFKTPEQTEAFIAKFREAVSGASIVSKTPEKAAEPSKASEPAGMTTDSVTLKWRFEGFLGHLAFSILFFACDMLTLRWLSKAFWLLSKVKNVTSLNHADSILPLCLFAGYFILCPFNSWSFGSKIAFKFSCWESL